MPQPRPTQNGLIRTQPMLQSDSSLKSMAIAEYLQKMALPSMWNRELVEEDYELWDSQLSHYSLAAIKFAFENWISGGRKFPIPGDILPLCISYQEQLVQEQKPSGRNLDGGHLLILAMWNKVCGRDAKFREAKQEYVPLTDREIERMISDTKAELEARHA